jgi:hypothetical protein
MSDPTAKTTYRLTGTASGWAIERSQDDARAEFLDRRYALDTMLRLRHGYQSRLMWSTDADPDDDWTERDVVLE